MRLAHARKIIVASSGAFSKQQNSIQLSKLTWARSVVSRSLQATYHIDLTIVFARRRDCFLSLSRLQASIGHDCPVFHTLVCTSTEVEKAQSNVLARSCILLAPITTLLSKSDIKPARQYWGNWASHWQRSVITYATCFSSRHVRARKP